MIGLDETDEKFLREEGCLRVATVGPDNKPYVAPFAYVWHEDEDAIFVITRPNTKTVRNIKKNPEVSLLADQYYENSWKNQFVLIRGTATIVEDEAVIKNAISRREEKFPKDGPMPKYDWAVIRVEPRSTRTFLRERDTMFKKPS